MLERVGGLVTRRPRRVVAVAAVVGLLALAFGSRVAEALEPFGFDDPGSESERGETFLEQKTDVNPNIALVAIVRTRGDVPTSGVAREAVRRVAATIARDPAVARTVTYETTRDPAFVSKTGRATYVLGYFRAVRDPEWAEASRRLRSQFAGRRDVIVGGPFVAYEEIEEVVAEDLARAELIAFPIVFLLALWVFRGLVAALLPPLVGGLTVVLTFAGMRALAEITDLSIFALNLVTGLGLGLAIDWSLLVVSRFREELRERDRADAVWRTVVTAGRTVVFSALISACALASLLVFPQRFLRSMGLGGMLVALVGGIVSLVVLPAVLMLLGPRVNSLAPRRWQRKAAGPVHRGGWYRIARFVMRYPGRIAAVTAAFLLALGLPFRGIEFTTADARVLPASSAARAADDVLRREFDVGRFSPVFIAIDGATAAEVTGYAAAVARLPHVAGVSQPQQVAPAAWRVDVLSESDYLTDESQQLVRAIRDVPTPFDALVSGDAAWFVDQKQAIASNLASCLAILAITTLVLLFLMTGSVVLAVKSVVMNALTISAAFGVLVFVFQEGRLEGLLDYESRGGLDFSQPILLAAIAFGLSTDYGVFMLSRIKEAHDAGADNAEAVATGLERTGRIVTAAALLFCVAIGAFATSEIIFIKEVGVGTALAVIIDATIIRALLVPSLMALLGRRNWWAPRPLRRLHERLALGEA